jgi:ribonuclease HI
MNGPITISQGEPLVEAQTRILIYTDGACLGNPGPGGWAATIRCYIGDAEIDLLPITGGESQTTNNRMEMRAAIAALEALPAGELAPISTNAGIL